MPMVIAIENHLTRSLVLSVPVSLVPRPRLTVGVAHLHLAALQVSHLIHDLPDHGLELAHLNLHQGQGLLVRDRAFCQHS